jgi:hypothetical protein
MPTGHGGNPLEERKYMAALQLPKDQHLAGGINSVHLED